MAPDCSLTITPRRALEHVERRGAGERHARPDVDDQAVSLLLVQRSPSFDRQFLHLEGLLHERERTHLLLSSAGYDQLLGEVISVADERDVEQVASWLHRVEHEVADLIGDGAADE